MTKKKPNPIRFYILSYIGIGILILFSLWINIQTNPILINCQKLKMEVRKLTEENKKLEYELLKKTRLEEIDRKATEELHMSPPKKVDFIKG